MKTNDPSNPLSAPELTTGESTYRIGMMGCPSRPDVAWTDDNLRLLIARGFNTMQLNIAWGPRPGDEALNIEDVLVVPEDREYRQRLGITRPDRSPGRIAERAAAIRERIAACQRFGLRTMFHFGAPYFGPYELSLDCLERDVADPAVIDLYQRLLRQLHSEFPGIDDLLCYTVDQDATLHSEFKVCDHHLGEPLHERVTPFVNALGRTWRELSPGGRLWWQPWELSSGQSLRSVERIEGPTVGLMLKSNIAECQITRPVDSWLINISALAARRGIPVIVECYLNGPLEEFEPFQHVQCPQLIWRQLRNISSIASLNGIKEIYGNIPDPIDVNLQMTGLFFANPSISCDEALALLAKPYGAAGERMIEYWRLTSEATDLYPWDASWWVRGLPLGAIYHSMNAAFVCGRVSDTPSWESTRRSLFMKTDNQQDHPWLLEDVQLRLEMAAERFEEAVAAGRAVAAEAPAPQRPMHDASLAELTDFSRRCVIIACHLRETNLATVMRLARDSGGIPDRLIAEMRAVLQRDQAAQKSVGGIAGREQPGEKVAAALAALEKNVGQFLDTCFQPVDGPGWGPNFTSR